MSIVEFVRPTATMLVGWALGVAAIFALMALAPSVLDFVAWSPSLIVAVEFSKLAFFALAVAYASRQFHFPTFDSFLIGVMLSLTWPLAIAFRPVAVAVSRLGHFSGGSYYFQILQVALFVIQIVVVAVWVKLRRTPLSSLRDFE